MLLNGVMRLIEVREPEITRVFALRGTSWFLPVLPWVFGSVYTVLSVIEPPFRPHLLLAGIFAGAFGFLCLASNLTSRVLLSEERLDVRDYGVRRALNFSEISAVYTIPSTFSTIIAFRGKSGPDVTIHLGYWKEEQQMLKLLSETIQSLNIPCSQKAAELLRLKPASIPDETRPSLVEGGLALTWIIASSVLPVMLGLMLT